MLLAALALTTLLAVQLLDGRAEPRSAGAVWRGQAAIGSASTPSTSVGIGSVDPDYWISRRGESLVARGGDIEQSFTRSGVALRTTAGTVHFAPAAIGRTSDVAAVMPAAAHNEVRYRHAGFEETYSNGPTGLEQIYTLARRPREGSGTLTVTIGLAGSTLLPELQRGEVVLKTKSGQTALRYGQLSAFDSAGRRLPAHMELHGGSIRLLVDDRGARYPLTIDPFVQQGPKLVRGDSAGGPGPGSSSSFGSAIALSEDGNTAIVGAAREHPAGSARIFTRSGSGWSEQAKLTVAPHYEATFGASVAISADGDTAIVGQSSDGVVEGLHSEVGAAYIFTRSGSTWTEQTKLTASDESGWGFFGDSVALSASGDVAAIGGFGDKELAGAAWIFARSGSEWTQRGSKLTGGEEIPWGTNAYEQEIGGEFGASVALSGDGETLLVGGTSDDKGDGAAWIFTPSESGWTQQGPKLTGSEESAEGNFGASAALSGDGDTALLGGSNHEDAGAAWVFTRSGSEWTQQGGKLTPSDETGEGAFGTSVALAASGDTALIGGPADDNLMGAMWQFDRSGASWSQQGSKLTGEEEEGTGLIYGERGGSFGTGVAISADGSTAMAGGPTDHEFRGAVWRFVFEGEEEEEDPGEEETPAPHRDDDHAGISSPSSASLFGPSSAGVLGDATRAQARIASLLAGTIAVHHRGRLTVRLDCTAGPTPCTGTVELGVWRKGRRGGKESWIALAGAPFSIVGAKVSPVALALNATGRSLLRVHHGRMHAELLLRPASGGAGGRFGVQIVHGKAG